MKLLTRLVTWTEDSSCGSLFSDKLSELSGLFWYLNNRIWLFIVISFKSYLGLGHVQRVTIFLAEKIICAITIINLAVVGLTGMDLIFFHSFGSLSSDQLFMSFFYSINLVFSFLVV